MSNLSKVRRNDAPLNLCHSFASFRGTERVEESFCHSEARSAEESLKLKKKKRFFTPKNFKNISFIQKPKPFIKKPKKPKGFFKNPKKPK